MTEHSAPTANEAFKVETHGIDHIPESDRTSKPVDLFWIWLGAQTNVFPVIFGALVVSVGVGFWPAVTCIVAANLFWPLVGLVGATGPRGGTATFVISRSAFGRRGNLPPALLNWLTIMGWEAAGIILSALSLVGLARELGLGDGVGVKAACLAITMVAVFGIGVWGHATIARVQAWSGRLLVVGCVVLAVVILPKAHFGAPGSGGAGAWLLGFSLILAGVPFSWLNFPAEYHRYLPSATTVGSQVGWTTLGGALPGVLLSVLGAAAATASKAVLVDPIGGIQALLPGWFVVPFLLIVFVGMIANDVFSTYSSGLGLQILGVPLPRHRAIVIDAVVAGAVSVYAVFFHDFYTLMTTYLALMIVWIAPWAGVYLANALRRRNRYDVPALFSGVGAGAPGVRSGWGMPALVSWVVGMGVGALFVSSTVFVGPLAHLFGGGDLSGPIAFVIGAGLHLALTGQRRGATTRSAAAQGDGLAAGPIALPAEEPASQRI